MIRIDISRKIMVVTNLERRANLDILASLHRADLTDEEALHPGVFVHDAVHATPYFD